jgi:hypothetical protein
LLSSIGIAINPIRLEILKAIETPITLFNIFEKRIEKPMNMKIPRGPKITRIRILPMPLMNIENEVDNILIIV